MWGSVCVFFPNGKQVLAIASHFWIKRLISGPVMMLYCQSICCSVVSDFELGHTQSPGAQRGSLPSHAETCLAVSFCLLTHHLQIYEYAQETTSRHTHWYRIYMRNTRAHSHWGVHGRALFLQSKLQSHKDRGRNWESGREEGKWCAPWPQSKWEVLEGLPVSAWPELFTLI